MRIVTLNVCHARSPLFPALPASAKKARKNLERLGVFLKTYNADVIVLQEVETTSLLHRHDTNQLEILASIVNMPYYDVSLNVDLDMVKYGTAILSRKSFRSLSIKRFRHRGISLPKGFITADIDYKDLPLNISVTGVHLDPVSSKLRLAQVMDLGDYLLQNKDGPLIIAGDMNCEWKSKYREIQVLADKLDLYCFRPESETIRTHKFFRKRIDWILVSREFNFLSHSSLAAPITDHYAVCVDLELN